VTAPTPVSVAGLVLAAGSGSRLGRPKALVELDGELLVDRAVRLLTEGGCTPVLVVLGAAADEVRTAAHLTHVVVAPGWETGMGASLRAGLAQLPESVDACVVALVDQPLVGPEAVSRLRAAHAAGAVAAVATYAGRPRNPVLLDRSVWGQVGAAATGDTGARAWLRGNPGRVTTVPCDGTGSSYDIDTADDLRKIQAHHEAGEPVQPRPPLAATSTWPVA
jgi:CTP:molybdopterin cytidylyltransferase MocA